MSRYTSRDLPAALGMVHDLGLAALGPGWRAHIWRAEAAAPSIRAAWGVEFQYAANQGWDYVLFVEEDALPGAVRKTSSRTTSLGYTANESVARLMDVTWPWRQ